MHKPVLHLIQSRSLSIFEQLQMEEALLRSDARNWCFINHNASQAIVLGISGCPDKLIDKSGVFKQPLPVIRRFSGGGTVLIDEDTFFVTFICNQADLKVPSFPHAVFQWSEKFYHLVFKDLDFKMIENDYVVGNRKFGGNAQYMRRDRWLHHTSLLWNFDPQKMRSLSMPHKMPLYRKERSHEEFLCPLKDHLSSKEQLQQRIIAALESQFTVCPINYDTLLPLLAGDYRKATKLI